MTNAAADTGERSSIDIAAMPSGHRTEVCADRTVEQHSSALVAAMHAPTPNRVLFFNSRDDYGADVAVHVALMRSFDRAKTLPFALGNTQSDDAERMRAIYASIPDMKVRLAPLGLPSHKLNTRGKIAKVAIGCAITNSLVNAVRFAKSERIDVIHATDRPRDAFLSTLLGQMCGIPTVVHMHSNAGDFLGKQTMAGLHKANAIFAVSENVRQGLTNIGLDQQKIHVVHNATDPDHFEPSKHSQWRGAARARFGIAQDAPVVGIVARLIPWKGHHELLEALAALLPTSPHLILLIVGQGTEESVLKEKTRALGIEKSVVFTGFSEDVAPLLAAMDIFALPSYEEPFGLAITEAMAMQLPVIGCNSGGVPEIITDGSNGILIEPKSADQLAAKIHLLLQNADMRRGLGLAARKTVIERFSPKAQADRVSLLYSQLVPTRR